MKQLYTFRWSDGSVEEPLQATSVNQALMVLAMRLAGYGATEEEKKQARIKVFGSFKRDLLDYTLDEPYQHIRKPKPDPKPKPKKPAQMSFKGFLNDWPS